MNPVIKEINTNGFRALVDGLVQISGKSYEHVLIDQVGALLKVCLRNTPAASVANIVKRVSKHNNHIVFASGHTISFWKKADVVMFLDDSNWTPAMKGNLGGQTPRRKNGKTWHNVTSGWRWSPERWGRYQAFELQAAGLRQNEKEAQKSRGISKQSWLQIAADLGLELNAPGYVKTARPQGGKTYKNGVARSLLEVAAAYIEISNSNPIVVGKLDGWGILQRALRTRTKAFEIETAKGVFTDVKARARRYPGIFTDTSS